MSARGGARPGAGRKQGGRNKATIEREMRAVEGVRAAVESGVMPLDIMLRVMRGGAEAKEITDRQFLAAKEAAPYVHPKLNTLRGDPSAPLTLNHTVDMDKRIRELLKKARTGNG